MLNTQEMRKLIRFLVTPVIREVEESDAEQLMNYMNRIADAPFNNTSMRHGIIPTTVEGYRAMIQEHLERDNWVMYVADADTQLVGLLRLNGGLLPIDRHDAELHVSIDRDYRDMGLGSTLIQSGLGWAREHPTIQRIHLYTLSRNPAAIRLYERHGFTIEGILRDAFYLHDEGGIYADAVMMAKRVR
jgi:RimJ/RimL family protein N-acetyltransferase